MILPKSKTPPIDDLFKILDYIDEIRYLDGVIHEKIAKRLATISANHFERSTKICKIIENRGVKSPEQLDLIERTLKILNED